MRFGNGRDRLSVQIALNGVGEFLEFAFFADQVHDRQLRLFVPENISPLQLLFLASFAHHIQRLSEFLVFERNEDFSDEFKFVQKGQLLGVGPGRKQ